MPELFDQERSDWGELDWLDSLQESAVVPENTGEQTPQQVETKSSTLKQWLVLGGAVLAGVLGTVEFAYHHRGLKDSSPIVGTANQGPLKPCPAIPHKKLTQVVKIVHQPENPQIASLVKVYEEYYVPAYDPNLPLLPGFDKVAHEAAAANQLHLADANYYRDKIAVLPPFEAQLRVVNEYSDQFGFKVSVDFSDSDGVQPLDKAKVSRQELADAFASIINGFEYVPIEVVKAAGLKQLRIVKDFVNSKNRVTNWAADAYGGNHVDINLSDLIEGSPTDLDHELGHNFDYNFCGEYGFEHYDPQYTNLNRRSFKYHKNFKGIWQDVTISQYGASNQMEDKADMFRSIFSGNVAAVNSRHATIRQKYELLLARLNQKVPGSVEYLKQISP